jgi:hypothetical protein
VIKASAFPGAFGRIGSGDAVYVYANRCAMSSIRDSRWDAPRRRDAVVPYWAVVGWFGGM